MSWNRRFHFSPIAAIALPSLLLSAPILAAPVMPAGGPLPAPPTTSTQKSLLIQMQDAFTNIAQTVEPSVVNIKAQRLRSSDLPDADDGDGTPGSNDLPLRHGMPGLPAPPHVPHASEATGSGVIVRSDGYILTNDHVVEDASDGMVTVTLYDGREFKGKVFADYKSDLAVVKIDPGASPLPAATFAQSSLVRPGQWAIAIGSPFDLQNTMTVGVISALDRHQSIGGESGPGRYYPDLMQTDAAINPGNSGGPLFNIDGQVVGINVAIESPVEGSAGVGFAIPSDIAQEIMNALITRGKVTRGYLGLAPDDLTPALETQFGQTEGAFIRDVQLSSPAGKAGFQAADIVTSFDGRPIKGEITLREAISATPPGKSVAVSYVRNGKPGQLMVTLSAVPSSSDEAAPLSASPALGALKLGLSVRALMARDRQSLGLAPQTVGVLITAVEPGSPAETTAIGADLTLTGMILQKVNQTPISSTKDFTQAAGSLTGQSSVTLVLLYLADGQIHQTALTVQL